LKTKHTQPLRAIARIVGLFGVRGEMKIVSYARTAEEFEGLTNTFVGKNETATEQRAIDSVRKHSAQALRLLRQIGIRKMIMITGDNNGTAEAIANHLDIEYRAELLPQDKVDAMHELVKEHKYVAMVGDGVNDAPALAASTIGVAMGTAGTDTALETADIALMADDLLKLPFAICLSRKTLAVIKQNIALSIAIKALFLGLAIGGVATLWMAVFADMGASLLVIFNGMRLFSVKESFPCPGGVSAPVEVGADSPLRM